MSRFAYEAFDSGAICRPVSSSATATARSEKDLHTTALSWQYDTSYSASGSWLCKWELRIVCVASNTGFGRVYWKLGGAVATVLHILKGHINFQGRLVMDHLLSLSTFIFPQILVSFFTTARETLITPIVSGSDLHNLDGRGCWSKLRTPTPTRTVPASSRPDLTIAC